MRGQTEDEGTHTGKDGERRRRQTEGTVEEIYRG